MSGNFSALQSQEPETKLDSDSWLLTPRFCFREIFHLKLNVAEIIIFELLKVLIYRRLGIAHQP